MKQMLHELRAGDRAGATRTASPQAYKAMARISRIQAVMTLSWDVLSTLTPVDYLSFPRRSRDLVGLPVGAIPRDRIPPRPQGSAASSNHYDEGARKRMRGSRRRSTSRACARPPCRAGAVPASTSATAPRKPSPRPGSRSIATPTAGSTSTSSPRNWSTSTMRWRSWRHKHVLTVERIIGNKPGTGGSAGAPYLRVDAREARLPRAVVAEDRALSFKPLFAAQPRRRSRRGCMSPRTAIICGPTPASTGRSNAGRMRRGSPTASGTGSWARSGPRRRRHVAEELGTGDARRDRLRAQHP